MANSLNLNREQLAAFLGNNHERIKQFEKLFSLVDTTINTGSVDDIEVISYLGLSIARSANAQIVDLERKSLQVMHWLDI